MIEPKRLPADDLWKYRHNVHEEDVHGVSKALFSHIETLLWEIETYRSFVREIKASHLNGEWEHQKASDLLERLPR